MHLLLYSGTCAHIRTYVSIPTYTYIHPHTCTHANTYTGTPCGSVANTRVGPKYEQTSFSICFRLFEKWRTQSVVCAVPAFPGTPQNLCMPKKKDYCATIGVTFPPHTLFQNSRGRSDQRISLPEMHEFKNMNLINCLIDCIIFYRYKSDAPRVACIFTL